MSEETKVVPEEFTKVIKDFVSDIRSTFPEYNGLIEKWWKDTSAFASIENEEERNAAILASEKDSTDTLFAFCQKKLPPRFFDILYQNEDMFKEGSELDTEFLPKVHFRDLWQCDISQKTRDTIWKYLQLILFSIVGSLENKDAFGDTAKLFEAINQDEFKSKLEETLSQMQGLFDTGGAGLNADNIPMPNANDIHEHITGMLDGKLGKLAREIAEETAENLNMDMENCTDMKDVLNKLIKNPTKLMGLVKTVGDKLDTRIKSGELKESELIAEASELMKKMKDMPGMGNIQEMLAKMGMGGMAGMGGGGGKVNVAATEAQLNRQLKLAQTKERMRAKADSNRLAKEMAAQHQAANQAPTKPAISEEELIKIFSTGETVERTPRGAKPPVPVQKSGASGKKKKNKK